jgi:hypothetical protein
MAIIYKHYLGDYLEESETVSVFLLKEMPSQKYHLLGTIHIMSLPVLNVYNFLSIVSPLHPPPPHPPNPQKKLKNLYK